jgi:hypothetical protein
MMRADEPGVAFRLTVASVWNGRRQSTIATSPVVVGDEIEVLIEACLRLLPDDTEDLVDSKIPYSCRDQVTSLHMQRQQN